MTIIRYGHLTNGLLVRCATCSSKLLSTFVQDIIRVLIVQHLSWFSQSPQSCLTSYKAWNLSNENNQDIHCQFFTENWFPFFLWITWHKSSLKNFPGFCVPPILKSHLTDLMKPRGNSSLFLLLILSVQSRAFCSIFSLWFLVFVFLVLSSKNCCKLARGAGGKEKDRVRESKREKGREKGGGKIEEGKEIELAQTCKKHKNKHKGTFLLRKHLSYAFKLLRLTETPVF